MLVKVALDLALDRLFTYSVPEELRKKLAIGQLLSVPFGYRTATGFALAVTEAEEGDYQLKDILGIVDEVPFFSPALLKLVRELAAYTGAPVESLLRAALPAAVLKRKVKPRELLFVELPPERPPLPKLTERQQWLLSQLERLGGGWLSSLCRELKVTSQAVRALAAKGLVTLAVRQFERSPLTGHRLLPTRPHSLNPEQAAALAAIVDFPLATGQAVKPILLYGITGSGKTEVYLQAIAQVLAAGGGAIVMVPEIALTPQTVQRFASRFGNLVAVLHSALSDGERYDEWHRIRAGQARVVVGPRSAVFAPVAKLRLLVVDEEHEPSYKQDEMPRYHARDAAVLRGRLEGARVVLGSATPSLESWHNVEKGKYALVRLTARAGAGSLPTVRLVDMEAALAAAGAAGGKGRPIFSRELLEAISDRLARGEQTILFLNRRGYSSSMECGDCGFVLSCERCELPYTYHRADRCLRCHVCGAWLELPAKCPACQSSHLGYHGLGTERVEAALGKCFPKARILRMDADTVQRRHSHDEILSAFGAHQADILVGTQMIAKGLDFRNVTLVGVLDADASLNRPDFRAAERTFQLLAQVSGRAGRAELPGEVVVQCRDARQPLYAAAARADFAAFAAAELEHRRRGPFPPYCHLSTVNFRSEDLKLVGSWAQMYAVSLGKYAARVRGSGYFEVSEALPSILEKADGQYRWQIVMRADRMAPMTAAWRWIHAERPLPRGVKAAFDADAYQLM